MTPSLILLLGLLSGQDARATLESCQVEEGRWVCRYRLPDVEVVQGTTNPATVPSTSTSPIVPPTVPATVTPGTLTTAGDPGVLTPDQSRLVARCATAGWLSLCSKSEREEAGALKARADAYEKTRVEVGQLLSTGKCDDAVSAALAGGHLALAREARAFCRN